MKSFGIAPMTLTYLRKLAKNNNRPWFNTHKETFLKVEEDMIQFAEALMSEMGKHDHLVEMSGKQSIFRIYRDVRFSKDKSPYKDHRSGMMKRDTAKLRGGYYYHIQPGGKSFLGGGFWKPNPADLKRIRQEIAFDDKPLRKIINSKKFKDMFGQLEGDKVKTAPKGFDKDHPAIDLLRYKSMTIGRKFTDKEVTDESFLKEAVKTFRAMRPFFDYMSEVLTTDADGRSIV